ncbi:Cytochrome P450 monooxygenase aneD [Cladobotryum mycophilum]|uniref:Cytochrome P450 monooxygenase aneD n=1 Tax=Cladobotryum mycophilum TaxID=491253 RepID=A0ABR0SEL7_9HYPO
MYSRETMFAFVPYLVIFVACYGLTYYRRKRQHLPLPPGPPQLPLVGNIHQIPEENPWRTYKEWHQKYGPIITVRSGLTNTIILGSHKAARDLLDKRNRNYGSRPPSVLINDFIFGGYQTSLLPTGQRWRIHRRILSAFCNIRTSPRYRPLYDAESKRLLREIFHGADFFDFFRHYFARILFALTYGKRVTGSKDPDAHDILEIVDVVLEEAGRSSAQEAFPILNSLPSALAPWKRHARLLYERHSRLFDDHMNTALASKSWNFCKQALRLKVSGEVERMELNFILGNIPEATHSGSMVLRVFIMANILYPDAVRWVQEEIDRVVGPDRLPGFDDMAKLPHLNAYLLEVMRWRPITPAGMPHASFQDDEYMGYRIPKGTTVVPNHWSMDFDESVFPDPYEFRPQRWIDDPNLPSILFGFGTRVCPGKHIAESSVFIVAAHLLWSFNFDYAYEDGKRQEIDSWNMTQGADSGPVPFKASFKIRSPKHQEVVERECDISEVDIDAIMEKIGADFS